MNPLKQLSEQCGQSPWLDYVRRDLIEKGELKTLIERDGLRGVTSNPSIFEKAIGESEEYGDALKEFQKAGDHGISAIYEHLAMADIRAGADVLRPVWDATNHADGFISLECSPYLANTTDDHDRGGAAPVGGGGAAESDGEGAGHACRHPGDPHADRQGAQHQRHAAVRRRDVRAGGGGLYRRARGSAEIGRRRVARSRASRASSSAASTPMSTSGSSKLSDKAAARRSCAARSPSRTRRSPTRATRSCSRARAGKRWRRRARKTQRLLWASTEHEEPEAQGHALCRGADRAATRSTPCRRQTMDAFRDHGELKPDAVEKASPRREATMKALARCRHLHDRSDRRARRGRRAAIRRCVRQAARRGGASGGARSSRATSRTSSSRPATRRSTKAIAAETEHWRHDGLIRSLWQGKKELWTGTDEDQWLGWLHIVEQEVAGARRARELPAGGEVGRVFSDVVLLGMGGSSLGPEVLAETFGRQAGFPKFHMLDSTDPAQIRTVESAIDLGKYAVHRLVEIGLTLEPNIYMAYFFKRVSDTIGDGQGGEAFRRGHRSRLRAREARASRPGSRMCSTA